MVVLTVKRLIATVPATMLLQQQSETGRLSAQRVGLEHPLQGSRISVLHPGQRLLTVLQVLATVLAPYAHLVGQVLTTDNPHPVVLAAVEVEAPVGVGLLVVVVLDGDRRVTGG